VEVREVPRGVGELQFHGGAPPGFGIRYSRSASVTHH
jgi:hypothetical protein